MLIRRFSPLLILTLVAACSSGNDDGTRSFNLGMPHIPFPHIGTPLFMKQQGVYRGELQKSVEAGRPGMLWGETSLAPDCSIAGDTKLEVVAQPIHGSVEVKTGRLYALYPEGDRREACSGRLVEGMLAYYTAGPSFLGVDQAVLRGTTADGEIHEVTVDITVRPQAPIRPHAPALSQAAPTAPGAPMPVPKPRSVPTDLDAPVPTAPQS